MYSVIAYASVPEVTAAILSSRENRVIALILSDFEVVPVRDDLCIIHADTAISHAVILGILAACDLLH